VPNLSRIPTPVSVRWRRLKYRVFPALTVTLCVVLAWQLWHGAPLSAAMTGQVNTETADARSPAAGALADPATGHAVDVFDPVAAGQVIARIEQAGGKWASVVAPLAGQVVQVHVRVGEAVRSGQPLYTIAANRGRYVTAYVRSGSPVTIEAGASMEVRPRSDPARTYRAVVERVGPRYEPVPTIQLRDRKSEEWGLPILIALPADAAAAGANWLRPGEMVFVTPSGARQQPGG
jgi:hypothetical protein